MISIPRVVLLFPPALTSILALLAAGVSVSSAPGVTAADAALALLGILGLQLTWALSVLAAPKPRD